MAPQRPLRGRAECRRCNTDLWRVEGEGWRDGADVEACGTDVHEPDPAALLVVSLEIDNRYERYPSQTTYANDVEVARPVPGEDLDDWAYRNLFDFTGVGHEDGLSWYFVTIKASTVHELVGNEYEMGDF